MPLTQFSRALDALHDAGISWLSFVPGAEGPNPELCAEQAENAGLLLLLSFGDGFASQTAYESPANSEADPFDARSRQLAQAFAVSAKLLASRLVYPRVEVVGQAAPRLDLRGWLAAARTQYLSPLGTGVRPDCGPWLAVRAALVVTLDEGQRELLARRFPPLAPDGSPCDACETRPCVRACPAHAVSEVGSFGLQACLEERLRERSSCALTCHARLACPVGSAFRYPEPQLRYHYGVSLRMLQQHRR